MPTPVPINIKLHKASRSVTFEYEDGSHYDLSCEFLRVHSPSAEVRGHGIGQETLQTGKKYVAITAIEPVGNYAIKLVFDDGHESGIYHWQYIRELADNRARLWQAYLKQLKRTGGMREPLSIPLKSL